ncbi:MAG: FG-GAP repeat protein [Phycisphaerales bacterium]|nr:MAG: FG-GAP repeat protein [Phycisphaerales bacterium]
MSMRTKTIGAPRLLLVGLLLGLASHATAQDCQPNGIPDECDIDCGPPGGPCDVPGCGQSADCNDDGVPDECEIAADPLLDCDVDGVLNECELDPGERDCDLNGVCDGIDIADCPPEDLFCADCNENGIPDGCDIGPGGGFPAALDLADLDGANGFVIYGIGDNDFSGWSVSSAGDINHDAIDDVIIGAYGADGYAGEGYVVFGSANPWTEDLDLAILDGTNGFVLNGVDFGDWLGYSVSSAGDVNNDGIDDVIIGAPYADFNGYIYAGRSYVVFGRSSPWPAEFELSSLNGTNGCVLNGYANDFSGYSVTSAGDVNNDGIDDVIIGAPYASPHGQNNAGRSYVVFGSPSAWPEYLNLYTLDGTNGFVLNGVHAYDWSGYSVSSAGDVNNDGIDDVIIGAPYADPSGCSYVVFGRSDPWPTEVELSALNGFGGFVLNGVDVGGRLGYSVSSAGDVNNDGIDDVTIGAPFATFSGHNGTGRSYVVFGSPSTWPEAFNLSSLDGSNGFVLNGVDANDRSGWSLSTTGDVNGDGIDDFIIGAPLADLSGYDTAGESYVVFGGSDPWPAEFELSSLNGANGLTISGIDVADFSGNSVSWAGDVNNDGLDDLIIGAFGGSDIGAVEDAGESYVIFGRPFSGDCNNNDLPDECEGDDDCNENRVPDECDIATGVSQDCNSNELPDECDVPASSGFPGGFCVLDCSADCNENGIPDECGESTPFPVLNLSELDGANGFIINGIDVEDFSGWSVSSAGDVNHDGFADLFIGAYGADAGGQYYAGESYVVFWHLSGWYPATIELADLDGLNGFVINGIDASDRSGWAVSSAGDINNDGMDDLVIGAYGADPNGQDEAGESYVVFGGLGVGGSGVLNLVELDGTNGFVVNGIYHNYWSGYCVSSAGDLNNDLIDDLIIGAHAIGESYVIFGSGDAWPPEFALSDLDGENGFVFSGITGNANSVSQAGDMNNDGLDDVIIGSETGCKSYVIFGRSDAWPPELTVADLDGDNGLVINGVAYDQAGFSVSSAGDFNNDTIDDIIIGAKMWGTGIQECAGRSYVVFGHGDSWPAVLELSDLNGSNGFALNGIDMDDYAGCSVSCAGDVNNDGIADILIGAEGADPNDQSKAGESYIVFGSSGPWPAEFELSSLNGANGFIINGTDADDYSGNSVSLAGDVNNDGFDDFIIGAYRADPNGQTRAGESYVVFGFSLDCNSNGTADECDIADGTSQDCNYNWIPDECEARDGDCDDDGVPDDCQIPQEGSAASVWIADTVGMWSDEGNWCLPETPDNGVDVWFSVTVGAPTAIVTLNMSPSVSQLALAAGATISVSDDSGANVRTLAVDGPIDNQGILVATDRERLVLDAPVIDQGGIWCEGGVLMAVDGVLGPGEEDDKSILEINGAQVLGGTAQTIGDSSEIHLIGGAELVDVCVQGVVVPDGQTGQFGGTISNDDVFTIAGDTLTTILQPSTFGAVLAGVGRVQMTDEENAWLGDFFGSFTNLASHHIEGAGIIFGGVINEGTIRANVPGSELAILTFESMINDGLLSAEDGGTLVIESDVIGSGSLLAQGGSILVYGDMTEDPPGGGLMSLTAIGGTISIGGGSDHVSVLGDGPVIVEPSSAGLIEVIGASLINASSWTIGDEQTGPDKAATLSLLDDSVGLVNGPLLVRPNGTLSISTSSLDAVDCFLEAGATLTVDGEVTLSGSFFNAKTDGSSSTWSWAAGSLLGFEGGQGASTAPCSLEGWVTLEAASADAGSSGGADDFEFAELSLADGAHLSLVDHEPNRAPPRIAEAVYCESLVLGVGAVLNLRGLNLYVNGVAVTEGSFGGGTIQDEGSPFAPGDLDGDGDSDLADFTMFGTCLSGPGVDAPPGGCEQAQFEAADLGCDDDVDIADFAAFQEVFTG